MLSSEFQPESRLPLRSRLIAAAALVLLLTAAAAYPYGLNPPRPATTPYLNMPHNLAASGGTLGTVEAFPFLRFQNPTLITSAPGQTTLYVCEREGRIYYFSNDPATRNKTLFLDLSAHTQGWNDCGLLGMAFHPDFSNSSSPNRGYFYVFYNYIETPLPGPNPPPVATVTKNRLSRFRVADGSLVADPDSETVFIEQIDRHIWHNGGAMFFHPDDKFLYLSLGDEGGAHDAFDVCQKINERLFSGVIRIDVDKRGGSISHAPLREPLDGKTTSLGINYFIPNDNPWVGVSNALEEYFAIGLRSPHRMSIDPVTKAIWLGDVGQNTREEINLIVKGGNYQWPYKEGTIDGTKPKPNPLIGIDKPPIYDWQHNAAGFGCVIGGYVYRGTVLSELTGKYIYGNNVTGEIFSFDGTNPPTRLATLPYLLYAGLSSFGLDSNNELYLCILGANDAGDGRILKLARTGGTTPAVPAKLSQTGAFSSVSNLTVDEALIPYTVNSPLWSDGAAKSRWIAVPNDGNSTIDPSSEQIGFSPTGEWTFPEGTVFVKHFELTVNEVTGAKRRLETRLLVRDDLGQVYGVTYKWRTNNSDADLLSDGLSEDITITTASGTRTQTWYYPSRQDCLSCHNSAAKFVLGVKTRQQNGTYTYPSTGIADNQIRTWNHLSLFNPAVDEALIATYAKMVPISDTSASHETRVRSYLDANCAHCHRPNGAHANFDARFDTPLANQNIVDGTINDPLGIDNAKVVKPKDIWRSILHIRDSSTQAIRMPPLARNVVDSAAIDEIAVWINSLNGTPALEPVQISPNGGQFSNSTQVTLLHPDSTAAIRYTLNGNTPTASSPLYSGPITITSSLTVKAIAVKSGFDNSIQSSADFLLLREPENPVNTVSGLDYSYYEGGWVALPDFSSLTPVKSGNVANFDISPRLRNDDFAFRYIGYVNIPTDGLWTFSTNSDDGSKLFIGSTEVVANDGLHGPKLQFGSIGLRAGKHAITVAYFEKIGGELLSVYYSGPGVSQAAIPDSSLFRLSGGQGNGTGLAAEYFDNRDLTNLTLTRTDPNVNFDWSSGSPDPLIASDTFSVRWTGEIQINSSATYTFYTLSDDGVRLWVNNQQLINNWTDHGPTENSGSISLTGGLKYSIRMEYYENGYGAVAKLSWSSASILKQIIPQSVLYPAATTSLPVVSVSATDPNASETAADTGTFTVSRTGSSSSSLTVIYTLSGAANNGDDYTTLSGTVIIPGGSASVAVTVTPINDPITESNESVILSIALDAAYSVGTPSTATVTIADNDAPTGNGTGLTAEYYDNRDLTNLKLTRTDATIDFNWGSGSPDPLIASDTFSVRWQGQVQIDISNTYTFYTLSDDGVRLWIDNQLLIDNWTDHGPVENSGVIALSGGQQYSVRMEYYEAGYGAVAKLSWSSSAIAKSIIPQSQLYPAGISNGNGTGLTGEYYDNRDLTSLKVTRVDPNIDFNWGNGSPDPSIAVDTFSVRWTGQVQARFSETYTFYTYSDDGIRLWVNGQLLVDDWIDHGPTERSATITLAASQKYDIRLEYYENGYGALVRLSWSSTSQAKEVIPQQQLYPTAGSLTTLSSFTMAAPEPTSSAPVAYDACSQTNEDSAVAIKLLAFDADGDALTYSIASLPKNGILSGSAPDLIYTPYPHTNGGDSFTFTVNDGQFISNVATVLIDVIAVNDPPVAAFTVTPRKGSAPLVVTLDAAPSVDVDGVITSIEWQFGDGQRSTGVKAVHTYTSRGLYNATLTVTDDQGSSSTLTQAITVTK